MLPDFVIYLLKVTTVSGLLFLYYQLALRNKRFHYYNRFYLLLSVAAGITFPLLHLQWISVSSSSQQSIKLYNLMYSNSTEVDFNKDYSAFTFQQLVMYLSVVVTAVLFIFFLFKIKKLYSIKKQYPVQKMTEFDFINTDLQQAPFSFLKNVFWRNDLLLNDITGKQIFNHEVVHVQQKHSLDKLLMQTILCFFWMNPFFWLIRRELYLVHEFIADEKSVNNNDTAAFANMLLTAQFGRFQFLPAQSFYFSSIKRRLIMLTSSKKLKFSYARRLMVLPLLAILVGLFAFSVKSYTTKATLNAVVKTNAPFTLIVNAGHGGKDYGATGNSLYEKDIALKIAKKIKEESPQFNINIILTRDDDTYMSPQNITDFTAKQEADAFIAVHINNSADKDSSGMEVVVSRKNIQYLDKSRLLASAVLQNVSSVFKANQLLQQKKTGIWVLDHNNIPSALIECGYISNSKDVQLLQDDKNIAMIADNILKGVAMYASNKAEFLEKDTLPANHNTILPAKKIYLPGDSAMLEADKITIHSDSNNHPLYIVDGKKVSEDVVAKINPNSIESINVRKDAYAIDKYGDEGKNGVIEITLKKTNDKFEKDTTPVSNKPAEKVFTEVQNPPVFKGGSNAWTKYLLSNLHASVLAVNKAPVGTYKVSVSFKVDDKGNVSDVKALNDPGYGSAKEACRFMQSSSSWQPATQNNIPVTAMAKQTVTFLLSE